MPCRTPAYLRIMEDTQLAARTMWVGAGWVYGLIDTRWGRRAVSAGKPTDKAAW